MMISIYFFKGTATAAIVGALTVACVESEEKPAVNVAVEVAAAVEAQEKTIISATEVSPKTEDASDKGNLAEADKKKDEELSSRDLAL